jgi:hypothetical protein
VQQPAEKQCPKKAYVKPTIEKQEQLTAVVEGPGGSLTSGGGDGGMMFG